LEEALFYLHNVIIACEIQIKLANLGLENLHEMSKEAIEQVRSVTKTAGSQVQGKSSEVHEGKEKGSDDESKEKLKKWKIWDLEFEAQMRMLDNAVIITLFTLLFNLITKNSYFAFFCFYFIAFFFSYFEFLNLTTFSSFSFLLYYLTYFIFLTSFLFIAYSPSFSSFFLTISRTLHSSL